MSKTIKHRADIPDAMRYVLCNDMFMSGWGKAEGRTNTIILPCKSYREAEIVAHNARSRTDQKRVRIVEQKPRLRPGVLYSLMDRKTAGRWYEPGGFCKCREVAP